MPRISSASWQTWFTKFNAKPIDRRWLPVVEELYVWHHKNERYLRNEKPLARVAIVYSQQTATFYGGAEARAKVEDPALGFYQALVEARIPFEMVHVLPAACLQQFSFGKFSDIQSRHGFAELFACFEQFRRIPIVGGRFHDGLGALFRVGRFEDAGANEDRFCTELHAPPPAWASAAIGAEPTE